MRQEELNAAVDEAHRLGKKVACHVYMPPAPRMAIEAGVDTFEHGAPTPEEIDLAVQKGIAWTPTINIGREHLNRLEYRRRSDDPEIAQKAEGDYKERFENVQRKKASFEYALKAGLKLSTGTDSFPHWVRFAAVADEMRCLVDFGCTPMQAIQAATQWPAQAMGWNDIGSLEAGKLADLIAVEGDPISDLSTLNNVLLVLREGEIVKHIARDELKNSK